VRPAADELLDGDELRGVATLVGVAELLESEAVFGVIELPEVDEVVGGATGVGSGADAEPEGLPELPGVA